MRNCQGLLFLAALMFSSIVREEAGAQFVQEGNKLVGSSAVGGAQQGRSVSLSADGNTLIIGGSLDDSGIGAAWVFTRSAGVWSQQGDKLVGAGAVGNAGQGYSVSLSADGNTALVGGSGDNGGVGAAWVFTRANGSWTQQGTKLVGVGAAGVASQGRSVSLAADGNTALVGGPSDSGGIGAAWVFTRVNGVWSQQGSKLPGKKVSGSPPSSTNAGWSVSVSADGNTAIMGGPEYSWEVGGSWVFTRTGDAWSYQTSLGDIPVIPDPRIGYSVSLSADGNTALIGAPDRDRSGGAALVFNRTGGVWSAAKWLYGGGMVLSPAALGSSVSLSADGNTAVVGGPWDSYGVGATWVFTRTDTIWNQRQAKLVGTGGVGQQSQGAAVSISADGMTIVVGGPSDNAGVGATWVYVNSSTGTLQITLYDVETSWPRPGPSAKVTLYNSSGGYVDEKTADSSSQVTFTDIPASPGYYYRVNVYRDPWGWQYWGEHTGITIAAGATTTSTLLHNTPFLAGVSIYIDATNEHLAEGARRVINPGTLLRIELVFTNPNQAGALAATTKGSLILDRDKVTDFDIVTNSTSSIAATPGTTDTVYFYVSPTLEGEYWYSPAAYSSAPASGGSVGYSLVCTDAGKWNESGPAFVVGQVSTAPILASPANKAINVPSTVTLVWHSVLGASAYHLQISTDSTFASGLMVNDTSIVDTSRLAEQLVRNTMYFWRVRAKTANGMGAFSSVWSFVTLLPMPAQVQLVTPSPGASLNVNTVAFVWRKSQPEVVRYWFEIATDSQFVFRTSDSTVVDTFFVRQNLAYGPYWWRVRACNASGWGLYSDSRKFMTVTGIDITEGIPTEYELRHNFPNPFNPSTTIRYGLPHKSAVLLTVFNTVGQQVAILVQGEQEAGYHEVRFDASNLSTGVYLCRLTAGSFVQTRKLLLLR